MPLSKAAHVCLKKKSSSIRYLLHKNIHSSRNLPSLREIQHWHRVKFMGNLHGIERKAWERKDADH